MTNINTAEEIARIDWLLSSEQLQERIDALQRLRLSA